MKLKPSKSLIRTTISIALFFLVGLLGRQAVCVAAGPESAGAERQVEAVVINVDKWAVYVPNQVFYFDSNMDKKKMETLKRAANQLRNRRALITFYSTEDAGKNQRAVLSDIARAAENRNVERPVQTAVEPPKGSQRQVVSSPPEEKSAPDQTDIAPPVENQNVEKPVRTTVGPPNGSQPQVAYSPPGEKFPPNQTDGSQSRLSDAQVAAFVEALRLSAPHTGIPNDGLYSDWKVKAGNILRWSKRYAGREISPEEFQANPQEARGILIIVMGKVLHEQYAVSREESVAVRRAASWWMTGDPGKYDTAPTSFYTSKVLGFYMRTR
ncbi:MAG: hypothetical protein P4L55_11265 [Syntrophobacteraceae bacterium]|nr:hypothetical protein [Syntrophobacteraceae bacterium]